MKQLKILIACEESQTVCKAFRELGHNAFSCDLQECSGGHPEWHIQGDVLPLLDDEWDLMIAHPTCTYLSNAGIGYFQIDKYGDKAIERWYKRIDAAVFFMKFYNCKIPHFCIENPVGFMNGTGLKATQIIQPWYFGDNHKKRTCLWLKNLPKLDYSITDNLLFNKTACEEPEPIFIDNFGKPRYFTDAIKFTGGHEGRQKARSVTFPGIANAMAIQWSEYIIGGER